MDKLKLFIENFLVYGFGSIISKIIPLIMVPIVTRFMPDTSYYGISDLSNTLTSFGSSLAVMGMYDAMYRLFFDRDDDIYKKEICSTAIFFTMGTSCVVFLLMILFKDFLALYVFGNSEYSYLVYITAMATLVGATNSIVSAPTRMKNQRKRYVLMNTISPILSYSISIPLLLKGHFIIALPVAGVIAGLSCEIIFFIMNREWFKIRYIKIAHIKPLLKIAIPLLPNFLIYWVFNSSDRLMIVNILGTGAAGIYSVGAKLGMASQLIYTAFAGGWQYFAFSTMREKNQVESNSRIFEYLGIVSFASAMIIFVGSRPIYEIFFEREYIQGFIVAPYLFLAPLLQMLFQIACNQFLIIKKTWPNMFILTGGALVNIILNFFLIPIIGIEGAAIATLIGYAFSDIICVLVLLKMKLMVMRAKFVIAACLMIFFIIIWRMFCVYNIALGICITVIGIGILIILYREDVRYLINAVNLWRKRI